MLGVGFVVGAFVLGDTINRAFDDVFETANEGVAVQVRGVETVSEADRQPVPRLAAAHDPRGRRRGPAEGTVFGTAQIIGKRRQGRRRRRARRPWASAGPTTPSSTRCGSPPARPPATPDDVVIDKTTADDEDFAPGDRVRIITASGSAEYRLVGIVAFGDQNNLAGATLAAFTPATAQRIFDSPASS